MATNDLAPGAWVESQLAPVEDYSTRCFPPETKYLTEIESGSGKERKMPIVGPAVARVLYQLALIDRAKTVFEMGSAVGYSTIWWARAVGEGGRIIYTDGDRKKADKARRYFERAGVTKQNHHSNWRRAGVALRRKKSVRHHFQRCRQDGLSAGIQTGGATVRTGGLFVTDNALWSGRVAHATSA